MRIPTANAAAWRVALALPLLAGLSGPLRAADGERDALAPDPRRPNLLVLVADDMGVDKLGAYEAHPSPGKTPVLDALAEHGVLFRNAWSNPVCSPSRALIMTGLFAAHSGVGSSVKFDSDAPTFDPQLPLLPRLLARDAGYRTAAIGKWHLSSEASGGHMHPISSGFERHLGTIDSFAALDGEGIYFHWEKNVADVSGAQQLPIDRYVTSENVDDALAVIDEFGADPWFVWLAFNAPHLPYHKPPPELHEFDLPPQTFEAPAKHVKAAVQAMDTEIGRLLAGIRPEVLANTTVVFLGDNGTVNGAIQAPWPTGHGKGTTYEGGVNVPLIVAGAGVDAAPGSESTALVSLADLHATLLELGGVAPAPTDAVSFASCLARPESAPRAWLFAERFVPTGLQGPHTTWRRAARGPRFKLMRSWEQGAPETEQLFDLSADPLELDDLLLALPLPQPAFAAWQRLSVLIDRQQAALPGLPVR